MGFELSLPVADLMDEFLATERPKISERSYPNLVVNIRSLLKWLDDEELAPLTVGIPDALRYQVWLSERPGPNGKVMATGTMHYYLNVARRFYDFLMRTERVKSNPFRELRYPRLPEHLSRNVLTEAQMGRLLRELEKFDEPGCWYERIRRYRLHVMAEFLYATGMRIDEACSLTPADLDLPHRLVYVRNGKGGKPRTAFLTGYACEVMARYLSDGRAIGMGAYTRKHGENLFGGKSGMAQRLTRELKKTCAALELPVITPHGFRHSLGTHLLRAGCDMRYIQVILGHESLGTTQVYTHVDKDDLRRSLDAFHPRQWHAMGTSPRESGLPSETTASGGCP